MAASPGREPSFTVLPQGSCKCCDGRIKNMKLRILVTDDNNCIGATSNICIESVVPKPPNATIGSTVFEGGQCTVEDGVITVYLLNVSDCTVNLLVNYRIGAGPLQQVALKSGNISSGNDTGDCIPNLP